MIRLTSDRRQPKRIADCLTIGKTDARHRLIGLHYALLNRRCELEYTTSISGILSHAFNVAGILMMLEWLLLPGAVLLLAGGLVPGFLANRSSERVRRMITLISTSHLIASLLLLGSVTVGERQLSVSTLYIFEGTQVLSFFVDGTAALMLTLVAFIGWVICRYSIRYLNGELHQGNYFRWLSLTIGAVSLLAVSGSLATMFIAWSLSSLGIHKLLTHYQERPAAQRAAWTKFAFSRAGDLFLIAAGLLVYRQFGTLEFQELFSSVNALSLMDTAAGGFLPSIGALLITGAALKTAQFPFHTWLPDTLEAPTPVSALMHAGIVNAGGYVLIRLSPLLAWSPASMTALALLGAFTACFAAAVMLTQTSIKKSLAWSTIAQMGFMMLQCGLGAFSAAMLHIIAHSLYKSHAFLNSGDVLNQAAAARVVDTPQAIGTRTGFATLGFCVLATQAIYATVATLCGLDLTSKPGAFVLGLILCLGVARWAWLAGLLKHRFAVPVAIFSTTALSGLYVAGFMTIDAVVGSSAFRVFAGPAATIVAAVAVLMFLALALLEGWFSLHPQAAWQTTPRCLQAAYVHASNGFYIDAAFARSMRAVSSRAPRPAGVSLSVTLQITRKDIV